MRVKVTNKLGDIVEVNRRSASAKTGIDIIELSTLGDLISWSDAEEMRESWKERAVRVRQLTNMKCAQPWTEVEGFISTCMNVRYIERSLLPIETEVLVFDNVVAFYRVVPEVSVVIIEDAQFANQQRALFQASWERATPVVLGSDGSYKYL